MNSRLNTAIEGTIGMLENLIDRGGSKEAVSAMIEELKAAANEPSRLAIFMEGGIIQEVYTVQPTEVMLVDLDECPEEELKEYPTRAGNTNKAYVGTSVSYDKHSVVEEDYEYVERLFKSQE